MKKKKKFQHTMASDIKNMFSISEHAISMTVAPKIVFHLNNLLAFVMFNVSPKSN